MKRFEAVLAGTARNRFEYHLGFRTLSFVLGDGVCGRLRSSSQAWAPHGSARRSPFGV